MGQAVQVTRPGRATSLKAQPMQGAGTGRLALGKQVARELHVAAMVACSCLQPAGAGMRTTANAAVCGSKAGMPGFARTPSRSVFADWCCVLSRALQSACPLRCMCALVRLAAAV